MSLVADRKQDSPERHLLMGGIAGMLYNQAWVTMPDLVLTGLTMPLAR